MARLSETAVLQRLRAVKAPKAPSSAIDTNHLVEQDSPCTLYQILGSKLLKK